MMSDYEYIAEQIRLSVWSGVKSPHDVREMISEILLEGSDVASLLALIEQEFANKSNAERSWPPQTDCDRLSQVFCDLNDNGVIAIENAGWDKREAMQQCLDAYAHHPRQADYFGICYYTAQDIDQALDSGELYLGFASCKRETEANDAGRCADIIQSALHHAGFQSSWDGNISNRIKISLLWQKRLRLE